MGLHKTLYVSDEDAKMLDDARLLSGDSLSNLVCTLVRNWVERNDPDGSRRKKLRELRVSPRRRRHG